jgi:hypothetical protein
VGTVTAPVFERGKLNIGPIDSGSWGSGGKGKFADYYAQREPLDFAISQNTANASHVTVFDDGTSYKFRHLPSSVSRPGLRAVIGADAAIDAPVLLREIADWHLTPGGGPCSAGWLYIHPNASVITDADRRYEEEHLGRIGSTMSGVAAAKSMKILRHPGVTTADSVPELRPYVADTHRLVAGWLRAGATGLLETAQGYDLSMDLCYTDAEGAVRKLYPFCTSRNITPLSFAGASFVPHIFLGRVLMNLRTFPIRVGDASTLGSKFALKFEDGGEVAAGEGEQFRVEVRHPPAPPASCTLTLDDIRTLLDGGRELRVPGLGRLRAVVAVGSSGGVYPDQREMTWAEVSAVAGAPVEERTSMTNRVRRVFSFSDMQLRNATMVCAPAVISVNFANYLDASVAGRRGAVTDAELARDHPAVHAFVERVRWGQYWSGAAAGRVQFLGTGPRRSDVLELV